jgi:hypothetical protein
MLHRIAVTGIAETLIAVTPGSGPSGVQRARTRNPTRFNRCDSVAGRGAALRDYIVSIVTGVGPGADRVRAASSLPAGQAGIVTVVSDDSVCAAAYGAQIRLKHGGDSTVVGRIALVQVGTNRYVVEDISRRAGEWALLDVYDSSRNYLASITR